RASDGLVERRGAGKDVAEADAARHSQTLGDAGAAQVAVNEKNARAFLSEHDRGINAGGGFAFLGKRASHKNAFRRRAERGEQQSRAQGTVRFRDLRLWPGLRDQFDWGSAVPDYSGGQLLAKLGMRRLDAERNNSQRGQSSDDLRLLGGAHGRVQAFEEECQTNARAESQQEPESKVARNVGFGRGGRNAGRIHDADVVGAQSGGDARLFQLLQQTFIELTAGFNVALERAVFDGALVQLVLFLLLGLKGLAQHIFASDRGEVLILDAGTDLLDFDLNFGVHLLQLVIQFHDFGISRTELTIGACVLDFQVGLLGPQFVEQALLAGGAARRNRRDEFRVAR